MNQLLNPYLAPYVAEILTNAKWTLSLIEQGEQQEEGNYERVKYYCLAVNTADVIAQLACNTTAKGTDRERAKKRLCALEEKYPEIPSPPQNIRNIRNSIHHFDERMDKWLFDQIENDKKGIAYIIDSNNNIEVFSNGISSEALFNYERRMINERELMYWESIINIDELKIWCENCEYRC